MGTKLLGLEKKAVFQNLLIYREVAAIRAMQSSYIERPMREEFLTLEDAIGRVEPIPLRLIDSWSAFDSLLAVRFKGRKGASRVAHNKYTLQERGSGKYVDRDRPWYTAINPGQQINMSVVCRLSAAEEPSLSHCPNCGTASQSRADSDVQW